MLSDSRIQDLSKQFVCVKIDPRETRDAMHHKRTRYVPEVVFLSPSQDFIATMGSQHRTPDGFLALMDSVLSQN